MTTTKVCAIEDVTEGNMIAAEAMGRKIIVARIGGVIHAMARTCPHMGADLCRGTIAGGTVVCPRHGAAFAPATGEPITSAKFLFLRMKPKPLATYPVTIARDDVLVTVN